MKAAEKSHRTVVLPTLQNKGLSYIERSLSVFDQDSSKRPHLLIDGGIGDYRMRLFRLKDKNIYTKGNHSVFTSTFTNNLIKSKNAAEDKELKQTIEQIIRRQVSKEQEKAQQLNQSIEQAKIMKKGSFVNAIQQGDHLIYPYISEYEKRRWFQTVNNSNRQSPKLQTPQKSEFQSIQRKVSLKRNKNKYVFAYMDLMEKQRETLQL